MERKLANATGSDPGNQLENKMTGTVDKSLRTRILRIDASMRQSGSVTRGLTGKLVARCGSRKAGKLPPVRSFVMFNPIAPKRISQCRSR